jgi:hypothetical protein
MPNEYHYTFKIQSQRLIIGVNGVWQDLDAQWDTKGKAGFLGFMGADFVADIHNVSIYSEQ